MKVGVTVLLCSLVVCALLIGSASSGPAPPGDCPENEEFVRCGKKCLTTCKPWNVPVVCNRMCYIGCDCRKGYQRNSAGTCVRPEECN